MEDLQHTSHFLWQPAACLRVTGEDALTFLQGQATNDLAKLMAGEAVYTLWLNQKGKVVADSFVVKASENEFLLVSYHSSATVIRERLEGYIIADDVVIEDETTTWGAITFLSGSSHDELKTKMSGGFAFPGRRDSTEHWEWIAPLSDRDECVRLLNADWQLNPEELERRRIAAGIAMIPQDIGPGELPNEGGLDAVAISYTKGCYLGQEVMARLKSMGQVRRQLRRVQGAGECPGVPAALFAGERQVGELRSAVATAEGFDGLALVSLMHVPADRKLALTANGPAVVTLHE